MQSDVSVKRRKGRKTLGHLGWGHRRGSWVFDLTCNSPEKVEKVCCIRNSQWILLIIHTGTVPSFLWASPRQNAFFFSSSFLSCPQKVCRRKARKPFSTLVVVCWWQDGAMRKRPNLPIICHRYLWWIYHLVIIMVPTIAQYVTLLSCITWGC